MDKITEFFTRLWELVESKHREGVYQSVCLGVLIALPFTVLLVTAVACCHCCCCGRRKESSVTARAKPEKNKRKKKEDEDLWISVHPKSMLLEKMPSLPA
ncbi:uncharacterized protein KIAA0040 homolog [Ambystoma mexicanum]|uniref:uncharacterized protein KIAA0040 homolog n=1 Tax=Ambystoma mexicanum TaxID=8296 RepID=UPI0037E75176